jgi:hypothetical protein
MGCRREKSWTNYHSSLFSVSGCRFEVTGCAMNLQSETCNKKNRRVKLLLNNVLQVIRKKDYLFSTFFYGI